MSKMRMVKLNILLVVFVLAFGLNSTALAITNGEPDGNRHPYVGLIVFDDAVGHPAWRCTGSLILPDVVLTAGHCTDGAVAARVWFSEHVKNIAEGGHYPFPGPEAAEVAYTLTHPDFAIGYGPGLPRFITHDVGLVILEEPVEMDEYGALPEEGLVDTLPMMAPVEIVGYGVQEMHRGGGQPYWTGLRNRFYAPAQLILSADVISDEFLRLTANPAQGKGGTCFGDSGGPAFLVGTNIILGVTSFGTSYECAGTGYSYRIDTSDALGFITAD